MIQIGILTIIKAIEQYLEEKKVFGDLETKFIDANSFSLETGSITQFVASFEAPKVTGGKMILSISVNSIDVKIMLELSRHLESVFGANVISINFG